MKRLFKCTLYALLCIHLSASVLTEALEYTNGYIVVKTIYVDPLQQTAPENKQIFQDVLMYHKRTHHDLPMYSPPVFIETVRHTEDAYSPLNTALQLSDQLALPRGRIEVNHCNNSPYLMISHDAKRVMQNIMNISNIPFNCDGFFMDSQQKIKIDIPDNRHVTGMFFSEYRGSLHYLSFQKGLIYQLSEDNLQGHSQDLSKKINELYSDTSDLMVVGYRFSNIPFSKDIDPESLSTPNHMVLKLYEENEQISMGNNAFNLKPFTIIQTTDFGTFHYNGFAFGGDDGDPEPFPIPIPGVGKFHYNELVLGRDDDDPEPFPIPIPGVGKFHYNELVLGRDDDDPEPFPIPIPGVGKSKNFWTDTDIRNGRTSASVYIDHNGNYIKNRQY